MRKVLIFVTLICLVAISCNNDIPTDALEVKTEFELQKQLSNQSSITILDPGFTAETFVSGLVDPAGLAFSNPAILFVNESEFATSRPIAEDQLLQILPNGKSKSFVSGLNTPIGLTFENKRGLFLSEFDNGNILQVSKNGNFSTFTSDFSRPVDLIFDAAGNLYVSDVGLGATNERIARVDANGLVTTIITYSDAVDINPNGLAFNTNGDLFIAELTPGEITKIPSSTSFPIDATLLPAFAVVSNPVGLAFDKNGDLFVAGRNEIFRVTPAGMVTTIATGLAGGFNRITFNKKGDMYFTDMFAGTVIKVSK